MPDPRPLLAGRLRLRHLIVFDGLLAALLVTAAAGNLAADAWEPSGLPSWIKWAAAIGIGLPVLARRTRPLPAFCASVVLSVVCALGGGAWATYFAIALPLHTVAISESRRRSLPALGLSLAFAVAVNANRISPTTLAGIALGWTVLGAAWAIGRATRERRQYAVLAAEQRAREAVIEERLRIARELHDVVAHSLSLITVKAGVAHHLAEDRPEEAKTALGVIESTTREALTEMRQILGVLRSNEEPTELAPSPGLAGLDGLAERARMAGVKVELDVHGPQAAPDGIEVSVYRIVQEALTNVVKHAAPANCRVTVVAEENAVRVEVTDDDGSGAAMVTNTPGHGLIGMRERVSVYGGTFHAGPRPTGGFAVSAVLPYA